SAAAAAALESESQPDPAADPAADQPTRRSGGPRTPEGRRRSSLNATRHSLCSKVLVLPSEEMNAYNAFLAKMREGYLPAGPLEDELVTEIVENRWRLKRARALDNSIFSAGHV